MFEDGKKKMLSFNRLSDLLKNAGFEAVTSENFFVTEDLQDLFLQSGKYRPSHQVISEFESECGDYLFFTGNKH